MPGGGPIHLSDNANGSSCSCALLAWEGKSGPVMTGHIENYEKWPLTLCHDTEKAVNFS